MIPLFFLLLFSLLLPLAHAQDPAPAPGTRPIAEGLALLAAEDPTLQNEGRAIVQAHTATASTPETQAALVTALLDFASAPPATATESHTAARRDVVRQAGYLADATAVPRFAALLDDADAWIEAVNALLVTPEGMQAIVARIPTESSSDKQIEYLRVLGQQQVREAREILEAIAKTSENRAVAWAAIDALGRVGVSPTTVLQRPGDLTKDEAARYASAGLRAAQELLDHGQPDKAESLFRAFSDSSGSWSHIRAALTGLNATGSLEAVRSALGYLGTPHVRASAKRILIETQAPGADEMIDKAAEIGDPAMQSAILEIYAERSGEEGRKKIEAALTGTSAEQRVAAARLLGKAPSDADLIELATKGGPWVRGEAINTFVETANARLLAGDHAAAAQQFRALLQLRPGVDAEIAALEGISQCGEYSDQELVGPFMGDPETGPAAYAAMARLAMKGGDRDDVIAELETIAEVSPHEAGVFAAAEGLAQLGLPEPKYNKQRGFLNEWQVLGPFPNDNDKAYGLSYVTESRADALQLVTWLGKQYRWEKIPADGFPPVVNLREFYKDADSHVAYVQSKFALSQAIAGEIHIGFGGAFELWLNGERIAGEATAKGFRLDDVHVPVTFRAGINKILVKAIQSPQDWRCAVRITDRRSRPIDLHAERPAKDGSEGVGVTAGSAATTVQKEVP